MVTEAEGKVSRVGPRHTLYLAKDLVQDSTFPFDTRQPLTVRVEGDHLIVEKSGRPRESASAQMALLQSESQPPVQLLHKEGFTPIVSKAQKIFEMLRSIHEIETLEEHVRDLPRKEHALYLWKDQYVNPGPEQFLPSSSRRRSTQRNCLR